MNNNKLVENGVVLNLYLKGLKIKNKLYLYNNKLNVKSSIINTLDDSFNKKVKNLLKLLKNLGINLKNVNKFLMSYNLKLKTNNIYNIKRIFIILKKLYINKLERNNFFNKLGMKKKNLLINYKNKILEEKKYNYLLKLEKKKNLIYYWVYNKLIKIIYKLFVVSYIYYVLIINYLKKIALKLNNLMINIFKEKKYLSVLNKMNVINKSKKINIYSKNLNMFPLYIKYNYRKKKKKWLKRHLNLLLLKHLKYKICLTVTKYYNKEIIPCIVFVRRKKLILNNIKQISDLIKFTLQKEKSQISTLYQFFRYQKINYKRKYFLRNKIIFRNENNVIKELKKKLKHFNFLFKENYLRSLKLNKELYIKNIKKVKNFLDVKKLKGNRVLMVDNRKHNLLNEYLINLKYLMKTKKIMEDNNTRFLIFLQKKLDKNVNIDNLEDIRKAYSNYFNILEKLIKKANIKIEYEKKINSKYKIFKDNKEYKYKSSNKREIRIKRERLKIYFIRKFCIYMRTFSDNLNLKVVNLKNKKDKINNDINKLTLNLLKIKKKEKSIIFNKLLDLNKLISLIKVKIKKSNLKIILYNNKLEDEDNILMENKNILIYNEKLNVILELKNKLLVKFKYLCKMIKIINKINKISSNNIMNNKLDINKNLIYLFNKIIFYKDNIKIKNKGNNKKKDNDILLKLIKLYFKIKYKLLLKWLLNKELILKINLGNKILNLKELYIHLDLTSYLNILFSVKIKMNVIINKIENYKIFMYNIINLSKLMRSTIIINKKLYRFSIKKRNKLMIVKNESKKYIYKKYIVKMIRDRMILEKKELRKKFLTMKKKLFKISRLKFPLRAIRIELNGNKKKGKRTKRFNYLDIALYMSKRMPMKDTRFHTEYNQTFARTKKCSIGIKIWIYYDTELGKLFSLSNQKYISKVSKKINISK